MKFSGSINWLPIIKKQNTLFIGLPFSRTLVETEISENRQWKLTDGEITTCIWATTFSDPQIWEEKNIDPAVYIHRIATNPDCRGKKFSVANCSMGKNYALLHGKRFVRLDTVGSNEKLINHYVSCGFTFLGLFNLKDTNGLPAHYHQDGVSLFELAVDK